MIKNSILTIILFVLAQPSLIEAAPDPLANFPKESTPLEIGKRVAENLLSRPYMTTKAMNNRGSIHYAEICTAYGARRLRREELGEI